MKNGLCLGCHTYFEEGYKVPLENMFIEFKNYYLPIKQSKQKWILLKTLVGFLNSKGGTIYIGIEDNEGEVIGMEIKRKQRDQFLLFMKTLADKIVPPVDFFNREEISIVYVPVVSNKIFKGKYVVKVIVKQGDPSKTYHFSQEIELQFKGKNQKYQIFHAFYRHNMGGIVQIRGEALLEQVARKAANPNDIANTFHKFCNPQPLKLDGPLTKIGFSGVRKEELRIKLQEIFHKNLQSFDVEYELTFDIQNQVLLIELQNEQQFKEVNKYVKNHLAELNTDQMFNFVEKGEYLDFYLYKNIGTRSGLSAKQIQNEVTQQKPLTQIEKQAILPSKQAVSEQQIQKYQKAAAAIRSLQIKEEEQEKAAVGGEKKEESKWCKILQEQAPLSQIQQQSDKSSYSQLVLTITHFAPQLRDDLLAYLDQLNKKQYQISYEKYDLTLELLFSERENIVKFYELLMKNNQRLSKFGVDSNLVIGINMRKIIIRGYNVKRRKELKLYIQNKIKDECKEVQFKKSNNKFFLEIEFKSRQLTCLWLDRLMKDNKLSEFSSPGAALSKNAGLRIYIYCECT